jgi:hypothetical protein
MPQPIRATIVVSGSILKDDATVDLELVREGVDYVILGATPAAHPRVLPPPPRVGRPPRPRATS